MQSAEQCRDCAAEYKSLAMRVFQSVVPICLWLVLAGLLERLADIVEEEGE
jgi:hypothetical protein